MSELIARLHALAEIIRRDCLIETEIENKPDWPVNEYAYDTIESAVDRIEVLEDALRDLLPYARACVPSPIDVGERNVIGRAEDLLEIANG